MTTELFPSIVLEGQRIRLEPLDETHFESLSKAAADPEIFKWYTESFHTPERLRVAFEEALRHRKAGSAVPFATIDIKSRTVIGTTRFMNIDRLNKRVEIGHTWLNPKWQRTFANTEAKFLMLRHAFEKWNVMRVEFLTDSLNEKSRNAILRIGAKQEGILRNHRTTESGRIRHSVVFSITDTEWPEVKRVLEKKLNFRS